jgi:outer membrane protein
MAIRFPFFPGCASIRPRPCAAGLAVAALYMLLVGAVVAQERSAPPLWEMGAFAIGVSQQAYPGSDTQVSRALALPYFIYRGEVLRADRGAAGLRALRTDRFELDIGVAGAFGSRAAEVPARQGMPNLGTLIEFGPRLNWKLGDPAEARSSTGRWRLELPLRGVFDLSDEFRHRGISFEPELIFERRSLGGLNYSVSASAIFGDQRLSDVFYGVAPEFATGSRTAYSAEAGLIAWRLGTSMSYALSRDWRVFGFARLDSVSGAANADSPLVRRTVGSTAGIGLSWTWMRSRQAGAD